MFDYWRVELTHWQPWQSWNDTKQLVPALGDEVEQTILLMVYRCWHTAQTWFTWMYCLKKKTVLANIAKIGGFIPVSVGQILVLLDWATLPLAFNVWPSDSVSWFTLYLICWMSLPTTVFCFWQRLATVGKYSYVCTEHLGWFTLYRDIARAPNTCSYSSWECRP